MAEEVKEVVFQMFPTKTPSPDSMPSLFFQKYWGIIRKDVSDNVLNFLNEGAFLYVLNFTNIVLILKIRQPENITQLRPISLCNVIYKIVSKILVNS